MPNNYFIPVSSAEIEDVLREHALGDAWEHQVFDQFSRIYSRLYLLRLHSRLRALKRLYAPLDPDRNDGRSVAGVDADELLAELHKLLIQANYRELGHGEIETALGSVSPHGIEVGVDLQDFQHLQLYSLGIATQRHYRRSWRSLWRRREPIDIEVYRRLAVAVRFKSAETRLEELMAGGLRPRAAARVLRRTRSELPAAAEQGCVFLRLFKDIPRSDLETLFPNRRVRMRRADKIRIGLTGGGGTISGVAATMSKLAVAVSPMAIAAALVGLAAVIFRQVSKVISQRTKYMAVLSRNLYFQSLDNNFGVLAHLVDAALEEECKEVLLGYCFVAGKPAGHYDSGSLDRDVEAFVRERFGAEIDFDVADGLRKLIEDELVSRDGEGRLSAVPPSLALQRLRQLWDGAALG